MKAKWKVPRRKRKVARKAPAKKRSYKKRRTVRPKGGRKSLGGPKVSDGFTFKLLSAVGYLRNDVTTGVASFVTNGDVGALDFNTLITSSAGVSGTGDVSVVTQLSAATFNGASDLLQHWDEYKITKAGLSMRVLQGPTKEQGALTTNSITTTNFFSSPAVDLYVRPWNTSQEVAAGASALTLPYMTQRNTTPSRLLKGDTRSFSYRPIYTDNTSASSVYPVKQQQMGWMATNLVTQQVHGLGLYMANLPLPASTPTQSAELLIEFRTWALFRVRKLRANP